MFGINARAEILCLLASVKEIHPSEAARRTAYYQKTVQTTLVEMSQSGAILSRNSKKEKFYRLKPGILDTLLKPNGKPQKWINWPDFLKIVEKIWLKISELSMITIDSLLLISEFKKLMQSIYENHLNAVIDEIAIDNSIRVEDYIKRFQEKLSLISDRLIS